MTLQHTIKTLAVLTGLMFFSLACNEQPKEQQTARRKKAKPSKQHLAWIKPQAGIRVKPGDTVKIQWQWKDVEKSDSVILYINDRKEGKITNNARTVIPGDIAMGNQNMVLKSYLNNNKSNDHRSIEVISDIEPAKSRVKIARKLHHDPKAYTQGLEIHGDYFYESTGQYKESSMRKLDIETGQIIDIINLEDDVFGEGMTIFDGKIYQLTWQSNTGFVYDLESFKQLYEFVYPTEGWGLTHDDSTLIMSDGSHYLYYIDPEYFTEVRKVSVYNHEGPVSRLNELEMAGEKILANIYGEDYIIVIDPKSGKVLQHINMRRLKHKANLTPNSDVLNGLAWDSKRQKLYATGKYWPAMFEVKIPGLPD